jgi:hypothetical protein
MIENESAPAPHVMPIDREAWRKELHLCNFVNTAYQYRDVQSLNTGNRVLIIGPGQGLEAAVFRWRKYEVTTLDIDTVFEPDVVSSCHDMKMFDDGQFDVAIVSHVLEHLPIALLKPAMAEIARVARHALVYLPIAGRHCSVRAMPGIRNIDVSLTLDLAPFWQTPDPRTPRYCGGQHYWEIGLRGFRWRDVRRMLNEEFIVLKHYRNADWVVSGNFILRSRRGATE